MEVRDGYKKTDVGVIPNDWNTPTLSEILSSTQLGGNYKNTLSETNWPLIKMGNLGRGTIKLDKLMYIDQSETPANKDRLKLYDVLFNTRNTLELVGKVSLWRGELYEAYFNSNIMRMEFNNRVSSNLFINYILNTPQTISMLKGVATGTTSVAAIYTRDLVNLKVTLPPEKEQMSIAEALSNADALIELLEKLIEKKRQIKQGAMQELLTGKKRLPGFSGEWNQKTLMDVVDVLDYLRVPLNDIQRSKMKGDIPYCGANGVVDFVNDYVIDDDIILIAEDGGYFDEYKTRPIAYRISGKCWVNNHAHILKAKNSYNQDFIYYSLVHKNILDYINGGTRAKLNKADLLKIEIYLPDDKFEQSAISEVINCIDTEISQLHLKLYKYQQIKQGMMQELLTGRIRLV